jgi:peptidoglycan/LPS O-acetylase OafA/YrhL
MKNHLAIEEIDRELFIDSLRGIAVLLVALVHALALTQSISYFGFGQRGVQLFYLVSAYTLKMSYDLRKNEKFPIISYAIRRYFRIFPVFYLAIGLNLAVIELEKISRINLITSNHPANFSFIDLILGFTFLHGISPDLINSVAIGGWSVAVEATFYIVLPMILWKVRTLKSSAALLLVSGILCPFFSYKLASEYPELREFFTFMWFPIEFPVFCMGLFAYYVSQRLRKLSNPLDVKIISSSMILLGACSFLIIPVTNESMYFSSLALMSLLIGLSLNPLRFLSNKLLAFYGKISYSFYLLHFYIFIALQYLSQVVGINYSLLDSTPAIASFFALIFVWLLAITATTPIAILSFKFIESPMIRISRALIRTIQGRAFI